jgi:hypothetical protein
MAEMAGEGGSNSEVWDNGRNLGQGSRELNRDNRVEVMAATTANQ